MLKNIDIVKKLTITECMKLANKYLSTFKKKKDAPIKF